jgi:hypothetical protein
MGGPGAREACTRYRTVLAFVLPIIQGQYARLGAQGRRQRGFGSRQADDPAAVAQVVLHLALYYSREEGRREVARSLGRADYSKAPLLEKVFSMAAQRFQRVRELLNQWLESV